VFEKNGWTGDAQLGADMMLRDLDSVALLEDWCRTLADSRDSDGRPALIAPSPGWHWPDHMEAPPWHSAYVLIPWRIHIATGDLGVLREHADGIYRYVRLEHRVTVDGLASTGLGDYLTPDKAGNPDEDLRVCATASVYDCTVTASRIAAALGHAETAREMDARATEMRRAFLAAFFDDAAGVVRDEIAGYRQTHNILALEAGLIPDDRAADVARALAVDVEDHRQGHLWVGALGVRRALQVLDRYGHCATAFRAATARDFPSWGRWRDEGATTMWEYWNDARSRNHYFLGTVDDWLFGNVAGVESTAPGWRTATIRPRHLGRVAWADAEIETVRGRLAVEWACEGGGGRLRVVVPTGCEIDVHLPGGTHRATSGASEFRFALRAEEAA
jgi:alpha-L-rhamnosidase